MYSQHHTNNMHFTADTTDSWWHGITFCNTGLWEGINQSPMYFPYNRSLMRSSLFSFYHGDETLEWRAKLWMTWDAMTIMWQHCNDYTNCGPVAGGDVWMSFTTYPCYDNHHSGYAVNQEYETHRGIHAATYGRVQYFKVNFIDLMCSTRYMNCCETRFIDYSAPGESLFGHYSSWFRGPSNDDM